MYSRQLKYLDLILRNNKVPHAFLFYGRDMAYQKELAKSFLSQLNDQASEAKIKAGVHPDTFFIRRRPDKKDITIAQVRDARNFVARTPLSLIKKGVFIEEAQYLNEEAWNALLKTLEEPVSNTIIFIISSSAKDIPATIISRVVSLPFSSPDFVLPEAKDGIILSKLAKLESLSAAERFNLADDLAKKESLAEIMDHWLVALRTDMLAGKLSSDKLEAAATTRNVLLSTNANVRLALESLFLKF
ncbi:MAG: hypothetical protein HYT38_01830 [Candidatus Sungbacteria bacterium]|uniref:DNA polymerase III subunit delta n=1 Tax=Candidatus Sungiibacteriota bacterium TaxID=2750080 RepID=A0A9D6HR09_9BACT|nr:hypothetical protein [Candidatus Sungbacteria bacterium]